MSAWTEKRERLRQEALRRPLGSKSDQALEQILTVEEEEDEREISCAEAAWRMRFMDTFEAADLLDQLPTVTREYANTLLSRATKAGLIERVRVGVYRPTAKAKALRGAA